MLRSCNGFYGVPRLSNDYWRQKFFFKNFEISPRKKLSDGSMRVYHDAPRLCLRDHQEYATGIKGSKPWPSATPNRESESLANVFPPTLSPGLRKVDPVSKTFTNRTDRTRVVAVTWVILLTLVTPQLFVGLP